MCEVVQILPFIRSSFSCLEHISILKNVPDLRIKSSERATGVIRNTLVSLRQQTIYPLLVPRYVKDDLQARYWYGWMASVNAARPNRASSKS